MTVHLKDSSVFTSVPKPGDTVYWWSSKTHGNVISVRPYWGLYPQWFTHFMKFKDDTWRGWSEAAICVRDLK